MSELAIELSGISKRFGDVQAVRDLDLELRRGVTYGLLGPNGSGKTTTMRLVLSILRPDTGSLRVLGKDSAAESKQRIGYLPEDRGLYKNMRVGAFLRYMARLRGLPASGLAARIAGWLERVDLAEKVDATCGTLSRGQQQRVQTVAALIHEPDLLILDEPFSGLDPVNRRRLSAIFAEQTARGCTLVLSTHMMQHAEEVCDHVVMMHRGVKVLDAPLSEARDAVDGAVLVCEPLRPGEDLSPLAGLSGVSGMTKADRSARLQLAEGVDPSALLATAAATVPLRRVELERLSLEEVFVRTVDAAEGSA